MKTLALKSGLLVLSLGSALTAVAGNNSYSATLSGNGITQSSDTAGQTVTGILSFSTAPSLVRNLSDGINGALNTTSIFTTDETCSDLANPVCVRASQSIDLNAQCLTVTGHFAWFAGLVTTFTPDPRFSDPENMQSLISVRENRTGMQGKFIDIANAQSDSRSLFPTFTYSMVEGLDNPILQVGEIGSISRLLVDVAPGAPLANVCDLKDKALSDNADYKLVCKVEGDPACSLDNIPALQCVHTQVGNVNTTTCTPPDSATFAALIAPYIAATAIQWLAPDDVTPIGDPVPNTIANLLEPPKKSNYSINHITRTFSGGDMVITRSPK